MASALAQVAFNRGWDSNASSLVSRNSKLGSWVAETPLGTMPTKALQELESIVTVEEYESGRILFLEKELPDQVFIVLAGGVRLSFCDIGGKRLTLRTARRGAVLGVHSAIFGSCSEWSADTLYQSKIAIISQRDFLRFTQRYPEVYRLAVLELMSTLSCACTTLRIVGLSPCIRRRLASQLLVWGERGKKSGDQTQFSMSLTHAQIAEHIGAARESVTRALIAFKENGLVEIQGYMLRIPSTEALRKYADRL